MPPSFPLSNPDTSSLGYAHTGAVLPDAAEEIEEVPVINAEEVTEREIEVLEAEHSNVMRRMFSGASVWSPPHIPLTSVQRRRNSWLG